MSLANPKPSGDLDNIEHNDIAEAKSVVLYGRTTSSNFIPILLNDDGSI